jgi:hypothetical protein
MRDWMFSSVVSAWFRQTAAPAWVYSLEEAADADHLKANAEVGGQAAAVVDGAGRGVGAGHADAEHVLRAQRVFGDGRHQRGVDAAAQADQTLLEAALAHVIARAQHQRAVGGLGVVVFGAGNIDRRIETGSTTTRSSSNEAAWAITRRAH